MTSMLKQGKKVLIRLTDKPQEVIAYRICGVGERAGMLFVSYGI